MIREVIRLNNQLVSTKTIRVLALSFYGLIMDCFAGFTDIFFHTNMKIYRLYSANFDHVIAVTYFLWILGIFTTTTCMVQGEMNNWLEEEQQQVLLRTLTFRFVIQIIRI